jgi:hypothetical protein
MASCTSSVRDRNYIDHGPNLLSRLPVSCPHDRKECLDTQLFVVRLLLISLLEHGDHVVVYPRSCEHCLIVERPVDLRLPSPRRTCIIADNVASSVVFDARTSSQRTSDSSTF